jgi:hypothetical protein
VSVENGRVKVVLEMASLSQLEPSEESTKRESGREVVSCRFYSSEEIKHLYVVCSRFPMEKSLDLHFAGLSLPQKARQLQEFLSELFGERRWYQPAVLKYFRIPLERLNDYSQLAEQLSACNKDSELDQTLGVRVVEDKNAVYFSVCIYKHLWVDDHYEFYLKAVDRRSTLAYYPIKRFSVRPAPRRNSRNSTTPSARPSGPPPRTTSSSPSSPKSTSSSGTKTRKSASDARSSRGTCASSPTTTPSPSPPSLPSSTPSSESKREGRRGRGGRRGGRGGSGRGWRWRREGWRSAWWGASW